MNEARGAVPMQTPLDVRGRRRGPVAAPGAGAGSPPATKGLKYPPQPFTRAGAQALLQACVPTSKHAGFPAIIAGHRLRTACVVMYRTGLRVQECLDLEEGDLDPATRQLTVRAGKGGKRRVVGMDAWAWEELHRWLALRTRYPVGRLFCTIQSDWPGRLWDQTDLCRSCGSPPTEGPAFVDD